jgi:hypothetical protein
LILTEIQFTRFKKVFDQNILNEHFFPNQNIALQEVYAKHQENRADAKIIILKIVLVILY